MTYYVYLLFSQSFGRHYIGHSEDANSRLQNHNSGKVRSTKAFLPWRIIYTESFPSRAEAVRREQFLKSAAGWKELKAIKEQNTP